MKFIICLCISILFLSYSQAKESCSVKKVTGFTSIKSEKTFFYKEAKECTNNTLCPNKRKAYLVKKDLVQTGESSGAFVCALYRNFNGYGGKETSGWLLKADLEEIKTSLTVDQIQGAWYKNDCGGDDSCIVTISKNSQEQYEVDGTSYLHDHPGMILKTENIKATKGKLLGTGEVMGFEKKFNLEVDYSSEALEPGTILLINADAFSGEYHR